LSGVERAATVEPLVFTYSDVRVRVWTDEAAAIPAIVARLDNLRLPVPATEPRREISIRLVNRAHVDLDRVAEEIALYRVDLRELRKSIYLRKSADDFTILYDPAAQLETEVLRLVFHLVAGLALRWGFFPLHAACLRVNGKGVVLLGAPGGGKSSLTFGLLARGEDVVLVTDDIAWVRPEAGRYVAHAANTYVKIPFDHELVPFDPKAYAVATDVGDGEYVCRIDDIPVSSSPQTEVDVLLFVRLLRGFDGLVDRPLSPELAFQAIDEPNTFFYRDVFHVKSAENPRWHGDLVAFLRGLVESPALEARMLYRGESCALEDSVDSVLRSLSRPS
jgi:hypothetical protein